MSLSHKIGIGFGGLIMLMAVSMGITLLKLDDIKHIAASAIEERQPAANYFQRLSQNLNHAIALMNSYLLTGEQAHKTEFEHIIDEIAERLTDAQQLVIFQNQEFDNALLENIQILLQQFRKHAIELFALYDNHENNRGAVLAAETLNPLAIRFLGNINILLTSDDLDPINPQSTQTFTILQELRYDWVQMMSALNLYVTTQGEQYLANFNNFNEHVNVILEILNQTEAKTDFREIEEMNEIRAAYLDKLPAVLEIFKTDGWRAYTQIIKNQVRPVTNELQYIFESTADKLLDDAFENSQELTEALHQIRLSAIAILIFSLLTGILLAISIIRGIVPPIQRLMTAANQVADGDLNAEVIITTKDEIGRLGYSFNIMTDALRIAALNEQQYLNELKSLNKDLEERVQHRTYDLEHSEVKIRAIFNNIGEGVIVLDDDSNIESINPAAEKIFRLQKADAIGLHSSMLLANNAVQQEYPPLENTSLPTASNGQQPHELEGRRTDGNTFPMELVTSHMQLGDKRMCVCILRDITLRKKTEASLAEAQAQLVDTAHKSGMADMATGVLHNIGNILNSVNLASEEITRISAASKVKGLLKANDLLAQHKNNLSDFFSQDEKGRKLSDYYLKIGKILDQEMSTLHQEAQELSEKTTMMKEVINTQQAYAHSGFHTEEIRLPAIVEDALKIQGVALHKWGIKLRTHFADTPICVGQKSKLLQVVTNLIKNAKEAMLNNDEFNKPKELTIETESDGDQHAHIKIKDNGCGIVENQLSKIFNHGFTTKQKGHGFGLHTSANAMTEMQGSLTVKSDGVEKGACFIITLPINNTR